MNRVVRIGIFSVSVVIFCYAGLGHVLGRTPDDKSYKSMLVYSEVLQKIQQDYVDQPNMHLVTAEAPRGLLETRDPESRYPTPPTYRQSKQQSPTPATRRTAPTRYPRLPSTPPV